MNKRFVHEKVRQYYCEHGFPFRNDEEIEICSELRRVKLEVVVDSLEFEQVLQMGQITNA